MKNYRAKYIKIAKGNKTVVGLTTKAEYLWWDFSDTKPVFVEKNGGKKK